MFALAREVFLDRPVVDTKTAHFFRQILKTVDFENGTLTGTFWKRHRVNT